MAPWQCPSHFEASPLVILAVTADSKHHERLGKPLNSTIRSFRARWLSFHTIYSSLDSSVFKQPPQTPSSIFFKGSVAQLQWLGISFDLGDSQLVFPPEIAVTTQRPDNVIFSRSKKAVLLVELTFPLEDRVAVGHTRKENRYAGLVQQCTENGWFARCFTVEVGCLGYVSPSLFHCLESLGIPSSTSRKLRNECSRVAHRCSYVLFLRRSCVDWTSWSMGWPFHLLKARLGSPHCSYLAARFSPCMSFPFSQACSPMPTAATMLALWAFSVSSFGPARPPHDDHSLVSTLIRMRSHRIFS